MSSSRIIKGALSGKQMVTEFFFGALQDEELPLSPIMAAEFQMLFAECTGAGLMEAESAEAHPHLEALPPGAMPGPDAEELQRMLQEASDNGFAEGRRESEESSAGICRTLSEAVAAVGQLRERIVRETEDDLLRLAIMVAKQIVQQEITLDRKILAQFVTEAIRGIADQDEIVICFHPDDCRVVSANRHLYLAGTGDKRQITIKPDDSIPVGGCVVDTPTGLVDARVETQLAVIFKRLMQERGNAHDGAPNLPVEAESYLSEQQYGAEKYGYQQR
jgi:flagellar assembly protein FliH